MQVRAESMDRLTIIITYSTVSPRLGPGSGVLARASACAFLATAAMSNRHYYGINKDRTGEIDEQQARQAAQKKELDMVCF